MGLVCSGLLVRGAQCVLRSAGCATHEAMKRQMKGTYGEPSQQQSQEEEKPGISQSATNEGGAQGAEPAAGVEVGPQEAQARDTQSLIRSGRRRYLWFVERAIAHAIFKENRVCILDCSDGGLCRGGGGLAAISRARPRRHLV